MHFELWHDPWSVIWQCLKYVWTIFWIAGTASSTQCVRHLYSMCWTQPELGGSKGKQSAVYKLSNYLTLLSICVHYWSILHGVDPLSYFSFQPVLHDWCMCYPVCGMMHIKEPLLLIGNSSPCSGSGFPLSLSEWTFTTCLTPYNRK